MSAGRALAANAMRSAATLADASPIWALVTSSVRTSRAATTVTFSCLAAAAKGERSGSAWLRHWPRVDRRFLSLPSPTFSPTWPWRSVALRDPVWQLGPATAQGLVGDSTAIQIQVVSGRPELLGDSVRHSV